MTTSSLPWSISFIGSQPFGSGLLNTLHDRLLEADELNLTACVLWVVAMAPLLPQAYLLLAPGTRPARAAIGVLGLSLIVNAWMQYRFTNPADNTANCFVTSAVLVIALRYIEWALLVDPIVDPWMARPGGGGRNRLLAALGLTLNVRCIFLGSVGFDTTAGPPNGQHTLCPLCSKMCTGDDGCAAPESNKARARAAARSTPPPGPQFPQPTGRPTTRLGSIRRHLFNIVWRFIVMDTMYTHVRIMGRDTILRPGGMPNTLGELTSRVGVRLLPGLLPNVDLPPSILAVAAQLFLPSAVLLWIGMVYHTVGVVAVASAMSPIAAWDVDMFDSPFLATSMIDLWGRRWHQVMRHSLVIVAMSIIHIFALPHSSFTIIPLTFLASAAFHTLAHLTMNPVPDSWKIMAFFLLSGVGCAAEVVFKRVTGRQVGGWAGRVWTMAVMLSTGRLAVEAWYDAGFVPSLRLPLGGVGDMVSAWLWTWAYTPFRRDASNGL